MTKQRGAQPTYPRICERCGTAFQATKITARFCSIPCTRAATNYGRNYGQYAARAMGETRS